MIAEMAVAKRVTGGSFLIEDLQPEDIFTPEDLSDEQKQIGAMTAQFAEDKILTQVAAIEAKQYDVQRKLMRELGELGLLGVDVPEEYGGMELDKVTSAVVSQNISVLGSFSVTFSAHAGDWDAAAGVVWHAGAEVEVPGEARVRGVDCFVCVV